MPAAAGAGVTASLLLLLGLSARAWSQEETDPDFSPCRRSFYRETPPRGATDGEGLARRCHSLPGGRSFASLYNATCGASVYAAYRLDSQESWRGERDADSQGEDDGADTRAESPPDSEVLVPALLSGDGGGGSGPALSAWDALVSGLVREAGAPRCAAATSGGADLFVLSGAAGLSLAESGGCQQEALWAAVCCASSSEEEGGEEGGVFSVGVVKGRGGEEQVVSMQELEAAAGVGAVFTGFCGEAESSGEVLELFREKLEALREGVGAADPGSEVGASVDADGEPASSASEVAQEEVMLSAHQSEAQGGGVPSGDSAKPEEAAGVENDTQSSGSFVGGALMYLLSSSVSLLAAPVHPVVSTLAALPGQVTYVLGEDLAALSAVPGGAAALVRNVLGDLWAGASSVAGAAMGTGELCFSGVYSCSAPLAGSLYGACYDGVAGVGRLAADTAGIFTGVLDGAWSAARFFGEAAWDHGGGYAGTVASELGRQVKTVGVGLGTLVWRVGRGLGNVAGVAGSLAGGTVGSVIENVKEAFGGE